MALSVVYVAVQRVLQLLFLRFGSSPSKDLEIVVLRRPVSRTAPPSPAAFRAADRVSCPPQAGCCRASANRRLWSRRRRSSVGTAS